MSMVAADALGIVVGRRLGRLPPERAAAVGAAVLFFVDPLPLWDDPGLVVAGEARKPKIVHTVEDSCER